jgi:hypothetical protein
MCNLKFRLMRLGRDFRDEAESAKFDSPLVSWSHQNMVLPHIQRHSFRETWDKVSEVGAKKLRSRCRGR